MSIQPDVKSVNDCQNPTPVHKLFQGVNQYLDGPSTTSQNATAHKAVFRALDTPGISPLDLNTTASQEHSSTRPKVLGPQYHLAKAAFNQSKDSPPKASAPSQTLAQLGISRSYPTILLHSSDEGGYGRFSDGEYGRHDPQSSQHSWGQFLQIPPPSHPGLAASGKLHNEQLPRDLADRLQRAEQEERLAEGRRLEGDNEAMPDYSKIQKDRAKAFGAKNVEIPNLKEALQRPPITVGRRDSRGRKVSQNNVRDAMVNDNNRPGSSDEGLISVSKDSDRVVPFSKPPSQDVHTPPPSLMPPANPKPKSQRRERHRSKNALQEDATFANTSSSYYTAPVLQTLPSNPMPPPERSTTAPQFVKSASTGPMPSPQSRTIVHPTATKLTTQSISPSKQSTTSSTPQGPSATTTTSTLHPHPHPHLPQSPFPPTDSASTRTGRSLTGLHLHQRLRDHWRRLARRRSERKRAKLDAKRATQQHKSQKAEAALAHKETALREKQRRRDARSDEETAQRQRRRRGERPARNPRVMRRRRERAWSADEGRGELARSGVVVRDFARWVFFPLFLLRWLRGKCGLGSCLG